jgi:hypothetical protein
MKYIYIILGFLISLFGCSLVFNHIDAWAGVVCFIIVAIIAIKYLINLTKKTTQ